MHCVNWDWIEDPVMQVSSRRMAMATLRCRNGSRVMRDSVECSDARPGLVGKGRR